MVVEASENKFVHNAEEIPQVKLIIFRHSENNDYFEEAEMKNYSTKYSMAVIEM